MAENWTAENIPDQAGRVVIVTGANCGIGYEAAKELARKGAQTILACRCMDRARAALDRIKQEIPAARVEMIELDLADLASVRAFAQAFTSRYDRLDVLVNNAGIMWVKHGRTVDGFERQFGTNHLGHFALTGLLVDLLAKTPGARVVNVSSLGHHTGTMDFDNLMFDGGKGYGRHEAYARSKLANLLFTYELQRRFKAQGVDAMATAAHPGASQTNLVRHITNRWYIRPLYSLFAWMPQSAAMGALPILRAAVDPTARGGEYYGPGGMREMAGYPVVVQSSAASHSEEDARCLWQVSEQLTGVHPQR